MEGDNRSGGNIVHEPSFSFFPCFFPSPLYVRLVPTLPTLAPTFWARGLLWLYFVFVRLLVSFFCSFVLTFFCLFFFSLSLSFFLSFFLSFLHGLLHPLLPALKLHNHLGVFIMFFFSFRPPTLTLGPPPPGLTVPFPLHCLWVPLRCNYLVRARLCGLPVLLVTGGKQGVLLSDGRVGVFTGGMSWWRLTLRPHPCCAHVESSAQGNPFTLQWSCTPMVLQKMFTKIFVHPFKV